MNRASIRVMTITALTAIGLIIVPAAQADSEGAIARVAKQSLPETYLTPKDIPNYYLPFNTTRTSRLIGHFMKRSGDQITGGSLSIWHTPTGIFVHGN